MDHGLGHDSRAAVGEKLANIREPLEIVYSPTDWERLSSSYPVVGGFTPMLNHIPHRDPAELVKRHTKA